MLFIHYPKCSTCQKAKKWLDEHQIAYTERNIVEDHPSYEELKLYRQMQLKDKLPAMSEDEQLELLATDGMLVKRPLIVGENRVLTGFKETEWADDLLRSE